MQFASGVSAFNELGLATGTTFKTNCFYTIGLNYSEAISKRWDVCSGLEYTSNSMTVIPGSFGGYEIGRYPADLMLFTIPVQFKYHLGKFFFVNGGPLLNIVSRISEKRSIENKVFHDNISMWLGLGLGLGIEHEFNSGIVLSLHSDVRSNGYFVLGKHSYYQAGASLGVGYKF